VVEVVVVTLLELEMFPQSLPLKVIPVELQEQVREVLEKVKLQQHLIQLHL
jgi:hypothetical protein